ncbi:MAG: LCP family protein [Oscillospiraceae bacterium]|nr:LCP family protein [Oscillospiraceae bacterium]
MRGKREAVTSGRQQRQRGGPFAGETSYKQTKSPKKKKKTGLLAGGAVTAVIALGAVLIWNFFLKKPDVSGNDRPGVEDSGPGGDISGDASSSGGSTAPGGRKEDYYTFLLLGRDTGGGGNTDTIILVSYDVANQQLNMMSIPRDTAVNVSWSTKKINSVYNLSLKHN